jgi:hypothetical protein
MAVVAKGTRKPSVCSLNGPQSNFDPQIAAEDIEAGDACRGTPAGVVRSIGDDPIDGYAAKDASASDPVTLVHGERMRYGSGLTVGTNLYLDTVTAGRLNTTAGAAGTMNAQPAARVVQTDVIQLLQRFVANPTA